MKIRHPRAKTHEWLFQGLLIVLGARCACGQLEDLLRAIANLTSNNRMASSDPLSGIQSPGAMSLSEVSFTAVMQYTPASVTDTFPTVSTLTLPQDPNRYRLKLCGREAIKDCMPYEPSSSAVPERLRGIWWGEGLGDPTIAISSGAGPFDPRFRLLTMSTYDYRQWGYDGTNSTWEGFYWSQSGAAFFSVLLVVHWNYAIFLNEDFSHAQIVPGLSFFGFPVIIPPVILDFTMDWAGEDGWRRNTRTLSVWNPSSGNYFWRRIINGDGSKASWYDKGWLTYKGGIPVAVPYKIDSPA